MVFNKIKSSLLILLFSFFSAFAMNVVLVELPQACAEESIEYSHINGHVDTPEQSFLFLDEVHHEDVVIYPPFNLPIHFSSLFVFYRNPYLNSWAIPPIA
jgi:hypothetical protein